MRTVVGLLGLLVAAQLGCRSDEPPAPPAKCDLDELSTLSLELTTSTLDASTRVWPGLVDACGDAIPNSLTRYYRATEPDELAPSPASVRLEVNNWLRNQGAEGTVAAPIMLALDVFDRLRAIQQMPELALAEVEGEPFDIDVLRKPNRVVYVTETAIYVDGQQYVKSRPDPRLPGLDSPRFMHEDGDGPTIIIAAGDTRIVAISKVRHIVAGFVFEKGGGFLVAPGPNVATWIPFGCDLSFQASVLRPLMSVELTPGGFTLLPPNTHEHHPRAHPREQLDAITTQAESARRDPDTDCVLISAADEVPLHDVLSAAAAVRRANWRFQFLGSVSAHDFAARRDPIHRRRWKGHARLAKLSVTGAADNAKLARAIETHFDELTTCYHEQSTNPELEGRMILEFSIGAGGRVGELEIAKTTLNDTPVEQCVAKRVRHWRMPTAGPLSVRLVIEFELGP
jgi:hypothetical protein